MFIKTQKLVLINSKNQFFTSPLKITNSSFGSDYCFPLAFGVPALFMVFATIAFILGSRYYLIQPANKENIIGQVFRCIFDSIYAKFNGAKIHNSTNPDQTKKDWLDYAPLKYDSTLIASVRSFIKVLVIMLPFPFYYALEEQQVCFLWRVEILKKKVLNKNLNRF